MSDLDARLIAAHDAGDQAALIRLYQQAADTAPERRQQAFFLTQAYVFALEAGHADAERLRTRLVALGAEPL